MSQVGKVLQRIDGSGWIAISDRLPTFDEDYPELANHILENTDISLSPFLISSGDDLDPPTQSVMRDLRILLDLEVEQLYLADAQHVKSAVGGLFLLTGEDGEPWVEALANSNFGTALREALREGALIFAIDGAASALGTWMLSAGEDEPGRGSDWLPGAMILPRLRDPAESEPVRTWLSIQDQIYALGLAGGAIVAYGPDGQFQLWGGDSPTVVLGSGW